MLKTIEAKMLEQNAHVVKYLKTQGISDAQGLVKEINNANEGLS